MITPNPDLLRHHILTAGTLTALEKRYLEKLVQADCLREACGCRCAYTKTGKAAVTAMCAKFQTYTDPVFCGLCGEKEEMEKNRR